MQEQFQDTEAPSQNGPIPFPGIEWSLIWLAVSIMGMVFLLFAIITPRSDMQPTYEGDSQIAPRDVRDPHVDQPEIGSGGGADSV